ncbi:hypothetical protein [Nocardioides gilvus]|uniref:hypothetical protein n=1 Tax=Nocardioides gilvus TaxID=1735589 RepID=UPI000D743513|nr:hypothetical protein [Nocardioides gilvus]
MSSSAKVRRLPWWVAALVAVQVGVPAYLLLVGEQPRRLGFQMYSGVGSANIDAVDGEGESIELPEEITQHMRVDVPWLEHLPEQICEVEPRSVSVTVVHGSAERTVTC